MESKLPEKNLFRDCDQLVANATEKLMLWTRNSRLVAIRGLTYKSWARNQGTGFVLNWTRGLEALMQMFFIKFVVTIIGFCAKSEARKWN